MSTATLTRCYIFDFIKLNIYYEAFESFESGIAIFRLETIPLLGVDDCGLCFFYCTAADRYKKYNTKLSQRTVWLNEVWEEITSLIANMIYKTTNINKYIVICVGRQ